ASSTLLEPEEQQTLQIAMATMAKRISEQPGGDIIDELFANVVEMKSLEDLPDNAPSIYEGLTVAEARDQIQKEIETRNSTLDDGVDIFSVGIENPELLDQYLDRARLIGDFEALVWLKEKIEKEKQN
ncbi:MAG: hypothetical protein AAGH40_01125, partial [Verrucomicrobiota bacterium]